MSKYHGITAISEIKMPDGIIPTLKYREGQPRQIRFNASTGKFNLNGEEDITKSGEDFSFVPVAIRIFKDNLFERGRNTWAEIFYINQSNQLSSIMFHGFSVENLSRLESELFYEDLNITQVTLTVKLEKKQNKNSGNAYYIASFMFKPAPSDLLAAFAAMTDGQRIYREDTCRDTAEGIVTLNYYQRPALEEAPPETVTEVAVTPQIEPAKASK